MLIMKNNTMIKEKFKSEKNLQGISLMRKLIS